jgi:predicted negative regulator of RcsB-dependent stress response
MPKFIKNNLYVLIALLVVLAAAFGGYKYYQSKRWNTEPER